MSKPAYWADFVKAVMWIHDVYAQPRPSEARADSWWVVLKQYPWEGVLREAFKRAPRHSPEFMPNAMKIESICKAIMKVNNVRISVERQLAERTPEERALVARQQEAHRKDAQRELEFRPPTDEERESALEYLRQMRKTLGIEEETSVERQQTTNLPASRADGRGEATQKATPGGAVLQDHGQAEATAEAGDGDDFE